MTADKTTPDSMGSDELTIRTEVRQQLTGPGGPFEMVDEDVLGETMAVFKQRLGSIRELLAQSALHDQKEYIVQDE